MPENRDELSPDEKLQMMANNWVEDRVMNKDPLMFSSFVELMTDLGHDKNKCLELKPTMTAKYKKEKEDSRTYYRR